jgi:hypothetical protein
MLKADNSMTPRFRSVVHVPLLAALADQESFPPVLIRWPDSNEQLVPLDMLAGRCRAASRKRLVQQAQIVHLINLDR